MNRKLIALLMSTVMALSTLLGMPAVSVADEKSTDSLTSTKGVYWFDTHLAGKDLTDNYIYDDELLKGDSKEMNWQLATMTYQLAISSISSEREPRTDEGYANKSRNIKAYLEDNGFVDFETNEDYRKRMTTRTMGVACAHKKITDGGKEYTVLALAPRSAGYEAEWGGNFMLGDTGDHEGFRLGKEKVLGFAREYIEKYKITGDIKVWAAGYSRGAGVTNQVGAELLRDPEKALGSAVTLKPGNLYCYTFGTPNSASTEEGSDWQDSKFDYIHNLWESYDITTFVPFEVLGFARYGKNFSYASIGDKERMLALCKDLNQVVYDAYTTAGDPEVFFKPKKLDVEALVRNREMKFIDDEESYLPSTQVEFAAILADIAGTVFGTRKTYKEEYQPYVEDLGGYYYSHLETADRLVDGIMDSGYAIPTAITMYIAYMSERYKSNKITADEKAAIEQWLQELDEQISKAEEDGVQIPQEILDQVKELTETLRKAEKLEDLVNTAWGVTAKLYSRAIGAGLRNAGLPEEDEDLYNRMTSPEAGRAVARTAAYFLFYDRLQTEEIRFSYLNQQFKHLATLIGNASSYQRPHNHEIILSWLRTIDHSYDDFAKEYGAQIAGYRRVYITKPEGAVLTGEVRDSAGDKVAEFKDGKITSRTDKWIGITTCDNGDWLRIPIDDTYTVILHTDRDSTFGLRLTEYSVYDGKEVREVTGDAVNKDWSSLRSGSHGCVVLTIPRIKETSGGYDMSKPSDVNYKVTVEGHSWNIISYTAATCDTPGTIEYRCTVCPDTRIQVIPATGHKWGDWKPVEGEDMHERACQRDPSHTEKEAHKWEVVYEEKATRITEGKRVYLCKACGEAREEVIPKISKKKNPLKVKAKKVTVKASKLKKKAVKVTRKKALKVTKAKGKVTYKKVKVIKKKFSKKITVNKKTGKITVKKGLKKGIYKVKIRVRAAGTTVYKAGTKTVTVRIRVK